MELTKTDIENILKLYNLGRLKNYKQVIRYREVTFASCMEFVK